MAFRHAASAHARAREVLNRPCPDQITIVTREENRKTRRGRAPASSQSSRSQPGPGKARRRPRQKCQVFKEPARLRGFVVPGLGFEPSLLGSEPSVLPNRRSRNGSVHLKGFEPLPHRLRTECAAFTPRVLARFRASSHRHSLMFSMISSSERNEGRAERATRAAF